MFSFFLTWCDDTVLSNLLVLSRKYPPATVENLAPEVARIPVARYAHLPQAEIPEGGVANSGPHLEPVGCAEAQDVAEH